MKNLFFILTIMLAASWTFASTHVNPKFKTQVAENVIQNIQTSLGEKDCSDLFLCCTMSASDGHNTATVTECGSSNTDRNCRRAARKARRELRSQTSQSIS